MAVAALSGMHVLLVEDEALLSAAMEDELEALGIVPLGPCPSVASAMDVIGSGVHLDGALLNVRLRGQLSFPIADELQRRSIPFVFVTGSDPTVTKHYPGVPVHPKPADMADIVSSLALLIGERDRGSTSLVTRDHGR